ncbi:uncharacterized protein LOC123316280 isoform X1 [Coccinella septempunctata]|uniref:uncharacterized protein LOC123316280 isoform X1 n=1 Tax=Coccinella septempunctata TaxID=41139 RepID=UPI001D06C1F2|nr:uncharacterized protein LOC123316280 isoform X1 [Coccinella septempunctata]
MPLPEIEEILQRFRTKEEKVETLLKEKSGSLDKSKENQKEKIFLSCEDVKKRNRNLMKDFEAVKGRLRSKAIFCPAEVQWENACREYQTNPSLPITTWKCQLPVFV